MKVAEIQKMSTADLQELIQTEKANYTQMLLNHAVSPLAVLFRLFRFHNTIKAIARQQASADQDGCRRNGR